MSREKRRQEALEEAQRDLERRHGSRYTPASKTTEHTVPPERILAYREELFVGPLPHPELLAGYDRACPGSAERIVAMAEKQADHRRSLEHLVLAANIRTEHRGQLLAFSVTVLVCGGGIYLLSQGQDITGLVTLLTPLLGLAGLFFYTARRNKETQGEGRDKPSETNRSEQDSRAK